MMQSRLRPYKVCNCLDDAVQQNEMDENERATMILPTTHPNLIYRQESTLGTKGRGVDFCYLINLRKGLFKKYVRS